MSGTRSAPPFDWTAVAPAWEKNADAAEEKVRPVVEHILSEVALTSGEHVLELGAGAGELAVRLAELVGAGGRLIASDVAAGMVDILHRRTAELPQVTVRQLDATAIDLPDASVDAVIFVMGMMFTSDPAAAAAEIKRVLAPNGRAAIAVWGAPADNPWLASIGMAAMANGLVNGPPTGPGGVFSLADAGHLRDTIIDAGFDDVRVDDVAVTFRYDDFDQYFEWVSGRAGPLAVALSAAAPEQLEAVRVTARQLTSQHQTSDGLSLPGLAHVAIARM